MRVTKRAHGKPAPLRPPSETLSLAPYPIGSVQSYRKPPWWSG